MFKAYLPQDSEIKKEEVGDESIILSSFPAVAFPDCSSEFKTDVSTANKKQSKSRNPFARKFLPSQTSASKTNGASNLLQLKAKEIANKCLKMKSGKVSKRKATYTVEVSKNSQDPLELFSECKVPDRTNIGLSCMYFADVPLYKRAFKLKHVIGSNPKFYQNSTKLSRYYRSKKLKVSAKKINFHLQKIGISLEESFNYSQNEVEVAQYQYTEELSRKLQELNMAVIHNPKDLVSWLALCDLQTEMESCSLNEQTGTLKINPENILQQNTAEREIAVVEKALQSLKGNSQLALRRLKILHHVKSNVKDVQTEWNNFLIAAPNNLQAWIDYFDFLIYNSKYDLEKIMSPFVTCFRYLIGMKLGTFKSHNLPYHSTEAVLTILFKFLYFLWFSGHTERCVALLQSFLEFDLTFNPDSTSSDYENQIQLFQQYYESSFPKIGEKGHVPWHQFVSSSNEVTSSTAITDNDLLFNPPIESFLKPELPVWKNWLALERFRIVHNVYSFKCSKPNCQIGNATRDECEDEERIVSFSFVRKFLFPFLASERILLIEQIFLFLLNLTCTDFVELILCDIHCQATNSKLAYLHLSHSQYCHEYSPKIDSLFEGVVNFLQKTSTENSNYVQLFLYTCELRSRFIPSSRISIRKSLRFALQQSGRSNDLKIWRVLLMNEVLEGKLSVVKKTVESLSKAFLLAQSSSSQPPISAVEEDKIFDFSLDCAIMIAGLAHENTECNHQLLHWIMNEVGIIKVLNKFRKLDVVTLKYDVVKSFTDLVVTRIPQTSPPQLIPDILKSNDSLQVKIDNWLLNCKSHLKEDAVCQNELIRTISLFVYQLHKVNLINLNLCNQFLRSIILETNSFYPYKLYAIVNSKVYSVYHVRRFLDRRITETNSENKLTMFYYALTVEKILGNLKNDHVSRTKSLLQRTIRFFPYVPFIWELYLDLSLKNSRSQENVQDIYQRAVNCVPLDKNLFMSFLPFFPEQIEAIVKAMIERKLRVRTPIEEIELFLNEICVESP